MALVFVSIGSNIDKERNVVSAINTLKAYFGELDMSSVYRSKPVGFEGDDFLNMVVSFQTDMTPQQVAETLDSIERIHGRQKSANSFVPRELDLDQLLYDDLVCDKNGIQLPRKEITENAFVLIPLAEINAAAQHPVLRVSYAELCCRYGANTPSLERVELDFS